MLEDIPLFSSFDSDALSALENVSTKKKLSKNAIVFSKGDDTDSLYVVASGKVKAIINDEEGKEIILSLHGPGEYFGEMSFIDQEPRSATVVTKEATQLLIIHRENFKKQIFSDPEIALNLLKILLKRLRKATDKIEGLAFMDVYGRIVNLFLQYAKPEGNIKIITEKLTHQEIANMIGSSREMVSKIIKELVDGGYISINKKQITLIKSLPYSF